MCRLIETIELKNGILSGIIYHNKRLNASRSELFGIKKSLSIEKEIVIPEVYKKGIFRCRVLYDKNIIKTEFFPIKERYFKSLKLVYDNKIDYHLKYDDRSSLNKLLAKKGTADEVVIIKNGMVTDCSVGNLLFFDGHNWITPDTPLLKGTQRTFLLNKKSIRKGTIKEGDICKYHKVGIINALLNMSNMIVLPIENIF